MCREGVTEQGKLKTCTVVILGEVPMTGHDIEDVDGGKTVAHVPY